jgi:hypothetical protein
VTPDSGVETVSFPDVVEAEPLWELGAWAVSLVLVDEPVPAGSDETGSACVSVDGEGDEASDADCADEESDAADPDAVDVPSSADATPGKAPNNPPTPSATARAPTLPTYLAYVELDVARTIRWPATATEVEQSPIAAVNRPSTAAQPARRSAFKLAEYMTPPSPDPAPYVVQVRCNHDIEVSAQP